MAVRIASNISSLQSQRRVAESTTALGKISERLSSGLRINKAADDAAGLQISEGLRTDSRVYNQAIRNVNDGLSLINIAQGAVQQLSNIVIRQAELAEQAANGTYSAKQRAAMNAEANALVREYNRIMQTTSFNWLNTLNGLTSTLRMQLGYGLNGGIDVGVGNNIGFAAGSGLFGNILSSAEVTTISFAAGSSAGLVEDTTITFGNGGSFTASGAGDYFTVYDEDDNAYTVWFNVDGVNSDPGGPGTAIEVNISSGDSADIVVTRIIGNGTLAAAGFNLTDQGGGSLRISNGAVGTATNASSNGGGTVSGITGISILQQGDGTDAEITQISFNAGGNFTNSGAGDYFYWQGPGGGEFYAWFNVDGQNSDPSLPSGGGIQVDISSSYSATDVAEAIVLAISGAGAYTVNNNGDGSITITNDFANSANDAYANNISGGSGIQSITVNQNGADPSANYSGGNYFTLNDGTSSYFFWFRVNGAGSAPGLPGTGYMVDITTAMTAAQITSAVASAMSAVATINRVNNGTSITATNVNTGAATDATKSGAGITVSVTSQGGAGGGTANGNYSVGGAPASISSGDFNGDGIIDLVSADSTPNTVSVLLGVGNGTFLPRTSFVTGAAPNGVTVADINGDGVLDLVTSDVTGNTASVLLGNGNGTFRAARSWATGGITVDIAATDVNGDGFVDLVTSNGSSANIGVLLGNGDGTFRARRTYDFAVSAYGISARDLNGDGHTDIVSTNYFGSSVGILYGNGDGSFQASILLTTGSSPRDVSIADLNGDGALDIITADNSSSVVSVFLGNGNGTFRARVSLAVGSNPWSVKAADMNGDGLLDIISTENSSVSILLGNGDGTFQARRSVTAGNSSRDAAIMDFDGDGILDIATANYISNNVSIFLGNADSTGRRNNWMDALDLTDKYNAKQALMSSKAAIARIGAELGALGAAQSRLSVAAQTLLTSRENFDSARSALVDSDVASDSASLVSTQIMQRAASAVLAQANQQPALALRLLRDV